MSCHLLEAFKRVARENPSLFGDAYYMASGNYGAVVSHKDGTVSKLIHRKQNTQQQQWSERELQKEISNLQVLQNAGITGFQIPELLGEPIELQSPDFYASYRMTKISGNQATWENGVFSPKEVERYFRHTGEVLGEFHHKATSMKAEWLFTHVPERGANVMQVPSLSPEVNNALSIANDYLQEHLISSVIHGDYHAGNILIDDKARVSGLIDFSQTGPCLNRLTDFVNLSPALRPDFIKGYEDAIQEKIDPDMIILTDLNMWAGQAAYSEANTATYHHAVSEVYRALGKIEHITDYKTPHVS